MITRTAIIGFATVLCAAPAMAQIFTHTHNGHRHSHDITLETTHGTCCQAVPCDAATTSHTRVLSGAPAKTRTVTRTYTRTHVTQPSVKRQYSTSSRSHYDHQTQRKQSRGHVYNTRNRGPVMPGYRQNDRADAWAHYDHRWKSRTDTR